MSSIKSVTKIGEREMSGEQDDKQYQRMLRHNLSKIALFDNNHAQQSPSSTYFLTDKITRDSVVLLNFRQSQRVSLRIPTTYVRWGFR